MFWLGLSFQTKHTARQHIPSPSTLQDYVILILPGLFFAGDLAVWHWSIRFTSVANATLLANFAPIFVTFGAWVLFKQRITPIFIVGLTLALAGTIVLVGISFRTDVKHMYGDILGIITALFYAGYILSIKYARERFTTLTIMAYAGTVCAAALLTIALISGESIIALTITGWLVLLALAWVSHVGGQGMIAFALAHLPAPFSSVTLLLQPVIAAFLAWLILTEPLVFLQGVGGIIVLFGIYLARRGSRI